jgi:hypothetical protein
MNVARIALLASLRSLACVARIAPRSLACVARIAPRSLACAVKPIKTNTFLLDSIVLLFDCSIVRLFYCSIVRARFYIPN